MKNYRKILSPVLLVLLMLVSTSLLQGQQTNFDDLDYLYGVEYQHLENGQRIAYIDKGKGEPLILIHGLGSYIPAWKQNIVALSKNHRVIALDLPGFGKSSKDAENYSIPFFAETVMQLQESLNIPKATWVGHSMGAQVAMEGALSHPQKISTLVLLAPAGFETFTEQEGQMMTSFVTPASIKATPDSLIRQTFKATFYDFPTEAEFMADDRVAIRGAENFDGYARAYAASVQAMLESPVYDRLPQIKQPVLIIYGKQDALIPNRQLHAGLTTKKVAESGHQKLPNSQLKMIDKAGHFVHFEQPDMVNKEILKFIKN